MEKAFAKRFDFDSVELRNLNGLSISKQRQMPRGMIIYKYNIYFRSAWGVCVARFDNPGNAKALQSGASDKHRLHVFLCERDLKQ